jgi:tetratricopeptide (TPR) repeat protein
LIQANPAVSEYHRNLGQAHEEMGNYLLTIDSLMQSLRWNPKNKLAMLLMGNIYVKYQRDFKTAVIYFDEAMELDEDNFLTLSNIGVICLQAGKPDLAERFFKRALQSNPAFPNALHGLGIVQFKKGKLIEAFDFGVSALKLTGSSDARITAIVEGFVITVASRFTEKEGKMDISADFILELEALSGKEIQLSTDSNLPVDAKIEIAANYDRDFHRVSYRPEAARIEHLICHELTHLKFILEARAIQHNQIFTSGSGELFRFKKLMGANTKKMIADGIAADSVQNFVDRVFYGLNSRVFNAAIDLFIEDYLCHKKPELRPIQFISLVDMAKLLLQTVTDPEILKVTPASLISKIKVYNSITAKQIDDLFGTSLESRYPLSTQEKQSIARFWEEFVEYRTDREPGEEYELVQHWADDLKLMSFFQLK